MLSTEERPSLYGSAVPMDYSGMHSMGQISGALQPPHHNRHIWIITGPAGCGKTTVAQYLAKELSIPYIEGDDVRTITLLTSPPRIIALSANSPFPPQYHSEANKHKMAQNKPLTDADRWDWLVLLRQAAVARLSSNYSPPTGVVVTCSALKRKYRDVIRIASYNNHDVHVHFIYLRVADEETLLERVMARQGHYMKSSMVHSQMEMLEEPDEEEQGRDVLEVDCGESKTDVQRMALRVVRKVLAEYAGV
ncbi:MAG: hypothetical protein M1830_001864 [Pleopsidium flavum]|nr:MAG: hypothetical protein M1830_001864 [Pleopsidium flavum]